MQTLHDGNTEFESCNTASCTQVQEASEWGGAENANYEASQGAQNMADELERLGFPEQVQRFPKHPALYRTANDTH